MRFYYGLLPLPQALPAPSDELTGRLLRHAREERALLLAAPAGQPPALCFAYYGAAEPDPEPLPTRRQRVCTLLRELRF